VQLLVLLSQYLPQIEAKRHKNHSQMKQRSKYGNIRTSYGGRMFDSKKEANHAATLDLLKHAKDPAQQVAKVAYQVPIHCDIGGVHVCDYVADFVVTFGNGKTEVQDVKGVRTDVYKLKKKLVFALHGIEIKEI
jgi:hypothetical protein